MSAKSISEADGKAICMWLSCTEKKEWMVTDLGSKLSPYAGACDQALDAASADQAQPSSEACKVRKTHWQAHADGG